MNREMLSQTFGKTYGRAVRSLVRGCIMGVAAAMITTPAHAAFHLWNIREIYSNPSGSLQFIELFDSSGGQQFVGGQSISVVSGTTQTFTIPSNLPSDSLNHAFLLGTAGLAAAGGPTPDFIIPNNFLFTGGGTINFFSFLGNTGQSYTALPTDGIHSRIYPNLGDQINSPQNFAGQIGSVSVPEPTLWPLFGVGGLGFWFLLRPARPNHRPEA